MTGPPPFGGDGPTGPRGDDIRRYQTADARGSIRSSSTSGEGDVMTKSNVTKLFVGIDRDRGRCLPVALDPDRPRDGHVRDGGSGRHRIPARRRHRPRSAWPSSGCLASSAAGSSSSLRIGAVVNTSASRTRPGSSSCWCRTVELRLHRDARHPGRWMAQRRPAGRRTTDRGQRPRSSSRRPRHEEHPGCL